MRRWIRLRYLIAIASSCLLFACAGCCLIAPYLFGIRKVDGEEGANKVAAHVAEWTLPPDFVGQFGFTIDNLALRFDLAKYGHKKGRGVLVIAQSRWASWMTINKENVAKKLINDFIDQVAPEIRKIDVRESEKRPHTVRGIVGEYEISHGEDRASTTEYHQVIGSFYKDLDLVYLVLQYEDGVLTDQERDDFLNSIH